MEANRKRRGFIKGKLMPFQRSAKPSSTVQYTTKVKPSQSSPPAASVEFLLQPMQKVSLRVPDNGRDLISHYENLYGVTADESVDTKAASYISSVQERFKLERINSERK